MLDDKDIQKLHEVFATKEDLKGFATKQDLERFATKEDLKRFATKEDLDALTERLFEVFPTREEVATKEDLRELRDELNAKMDDILSAIDAFVSKTTKVDQETIMMGHQLKRHERWIGELAQKAGHKLQS